MQFYTTNLSCYGLFMLWFRKTVYCLHTPDLCKQMPQLSFIWCTVCHYMIYTYNTDSLLSLISVLIAKTTDYIPCFNPFNLNNKVSQFGFTDRKPIKSMSSIYIYKVVCLSDQNSGAHGPIGLKCGLGNSEDLRK